MKNSNNNNISPVRIYQNADVQKSQVLLENNGKSGVYLWTNLINSKKYVGSSKDIGRRLREYFNINYLEKLTNLPICRALLKYGHENFSLEIMEYCDPSTLLERENHYFKQLKPEYNILQEAGNCLGFKHSEETLAKMSKAKLGKQRSIETIEKSR